MPSAPRPSARPWPSRPRSWPSPSAVAAGILLGAAWGFIPGALKAWTGAHEVVTTIMLNFIASIFIGYLITGPLEAPGAAFSRTGPIGNAAYPTFFGTDIHLGVFIAFALVPVVWWLLWRSTLGFEIRTVGANPDAARYAGMRPRFLMILTMSLCGLLAGLAGAGQILGISGFMTASYGTSVGFDAISVALLGRAHPVGIMFAALLFGAMRAGSGLMQIEAGIPVEIIDVIQAIHPLLPGGRRPGAASAADPAPRAPSRRSLRPSPRRTAAGRPPDGDRVRHPGASACSSSSSAT